MRGEPTLFELSSAGRRSYSLPAWEGPAAEPLGGDQIRRAPPRLPEVSELDLVRHFTRLSHRNFGVDLGFYPLGSCTMKYNPKMAETAAAHVGFLQLHPEQPAAQVQGALELVHRLQRWLAELAGMAEVTLQPAAGAQGELAGLLMIRAYHQDRGHARSKVLLPDTAHGTNPASVTLAGYRSVEVASDSRGHLDLAALAGALDDEVAALMITNPNTLGLFDTNIAKISEMVREAGALLYYDGANLNAVLGRFRPGDVGFHAVHFNLHKTFATPHGGGGPGAGPVGVSEELVPYLPAPVLAKGETGLFWDWDRPSSIGKTVAFYGHFGVAVRAYAYIRALGGESLRRVSEAAVLNANYLLSLVPEEYEAPFGKRCMHEFLVSARRLKRERGIKAMDVAKRLLDLGFHAPSVYFPLLVEEAMLIEPTETESRETLEAFAQAMRAIVRETAVEPEAVRRAPYTTPVGRLDEARAARSPDLRW